MPPRRRSARFGFTARSSPWRTSPGARLAPDKVANVARKKRKPRPRQPGPRPGLATGPSRPKVDRAPSKLQQQRAAADRARRRAQRKRQLVVGAVVVAVTAVVVGLFYLRGVKARRLEAALTGGSCTTDRDADPTRPPGQNHVDSPSFSVNPPAGGDHTGTVSEPGVFTAAEAPDGPVVHALEHGYIAIWHRPDLPPAERDKLVELQRTKARDVLLVERAGMRVPVAATAWERRLLCQVVELDALTAFADAYVNKGPEKVPHPPV